MDFGIALLGIGMGLVIAAPPGAVGLLCIRRTIERGVAVAYATGFGAAIADSLFGAVGVFGITAITDMLSFYQHFLRLAGGLFLLATAWWSFTHAPRPPDERHAHAGTLGASMLSGFVLTVTNPVTIFGNIALVAGLSSGFDLSQAPTLVAGIFVGSAAWWLVLAGVVSLLRRRMGAGTVRLINRASAVILGVLGMAAVVAAVLGYAGLL